MKLKRQTNLSKLVLIPKVLVLINDGIMLYVSVFPQLNEIWLLAALVFLILSVIAIPYPKVSGILLLLFSSFIYLNYMWIGMAYDWFNFFYLESLILFCYIIIAVLFVLFSFIKISTTKPIQTDATNIQKME
jgi:hypothetical protein